MDHEEVLVDEPLATQRLNQNAAAHDAQDSPRLIPELGDGLDGIGAEKRRVWPGQRLSERRRCQILTCVVQRFGEGIVGDGVPVTDATIPSPMSPPYQTVNGPPALTMPRPSSSAQKATHASCRFRGEVVPPHRRGPSAQCSPSSLPNRKSIEGVPEAGRRNARSQDQSEMRARTNSHPYRSEALVGYRSVHPISRHAGDQGHADGPKRLVDRGHSSPMQRNRPDTCCETPPRWPASFIIHCPWMFTPRRSTMRSQSLLFTFGARASAVA